MATPWGGQPKAGNLYKNYLAQVEGEPFTGEPWKRGDVVDVPLNLNPLGLDTITMVGGDLPPGLFFNTAMRRIQGTISALPKDRDNYPVVFRATMLSGRTYDRSFRWVVDPVDEEQYWSGGGEYEGWLPEGDGNWIPSSDKNTVLQTRNGNATVYYGPSNAMGRSIKGTIQVNSIAGDNDFIGFVVGYRPGDIANTTTDFLLVDWKRSNQGSATRGMAISRVLQGLDRLSGEENWGHIPELGVHELARAKNLGSTPWNFDTSYRFEIAFSSTNIKVYINDILEFDLSGTFSDGRFGFYNNSQAQVTYAGIADDPAGTFTRLGSVNRGSSVTMQLDIINLDQDPLVYKAVGFRGPQGSYEGLPIGLDIDQFGRIIGSPTISANQPGDYYFRVYARDPDGLLSNPRGEGSPRTSEKIFVLTVSPDIVLDPRLSDVVRWETPPGSLGSCYETYASHFAIKAVPQYEISQGNTTETQTIRYTLTPKSKPLPEGLLLDQASGLILGRCPYVTISKTFEFTVEARVAFIHNTTGEVRLSSIAGERTFSITVRSIFAADSLTSIQINVPAPARNKIVPWIWGNKADTRTLHEPEVLSRNQLFRAADQYFGRKRDFRILLINGLNYTTGEFFERIKDYHHPTDLRIGPLASAKARSPEGNHIYDVIYLGIIDPLQGAGGFNAFNQEESLSRYRVGQKKTAIPQWNLTAENPNYYPNSIKNLRADLINRNNRQPGQIGYGISGREGLPLWMMSEQDAGKPGTVPGYQCVIELANVRPGSGPAIVKALVQAGINEDLVGTTITVDRYLLLSDGTAATTFDGSEFGYLEITTFDGPDNLFTPTPNYTTFDTSLQSESKYYKFPPGDK